MSYERMSHERMSDERLFGCLASADMTLTRMSPNPKIR